MSVDQFKEILRNGYSLDLLYLLQYAEDGGDLMELGLESPKLNNLLTSLIRKGLLHEGKPSVEGKEILKFVTTKVSTGKFVKPKPKVEEFDKFWSTFPGTDTFTAGGKSFKGTRALRVKKDDCRAKIAKIVGEGDYTLDMIIKALELEISQKKENSVKTGQNKMSYFQNSLTWLNQRTFEPYIELVKEGHKVETQTEKYDGINI